jgi:bifunctional non-homologous end joining protein LigD
VGRTGQLDHEGHRWARRDDPEGDVGSRPPADVVHHDLIADQLEGDPVGPRIPPAGMVPHATREATERSGRGEEPGVVDPPRLDPHARSLPGVSQNTLPRSLVPMKATAGTLPEGPDWRYEVKWDGMRALAFIDGASLRIQSANERDVTASWPELSGLPEAVPGTTMLLDGELVATDDEGQPSFGRLQQRMHVANAAEAARRAVEVPITYVVFDILHLDGHDLMPLPLTDRRRLLEQVLEPAPSWRCSPVHDEGATLLAAAQELGLEGIVAKRADSPYEPGKRTRSWLKVKVRRRQEMVVGGWLPGEGGRGGRIGALLVGYHDSPGDQGPLRFAGRVGTGFTEAELARLAGMLEPLATEECPFEPSPPRADVARGATWVRPELVAELAFAEWTGDGRLRHPSYLGLRTDKAAADVTRDE